MVWCLPSRCDNAEASARKVGAKGWIGMTWPQQYGGHERSHLERYVVIEEMLAARAPTRHYSTADRQSGQDSQAHDPVAPPHKRERDINLLAQRNWADLRLGFEGRLHRH